MFFKLFCSILMVAPFIQGIKGYPMNIAGEKCMEMLQKLCAEAEEGKDAHNHHLIIQNENGIYDRIVTDLKSWSRMAYIKQMETEPTDEELEEYMYDFLKKVVAASKKKIIEGKKNSEEKQLLVEFDKSPSLK